MRRFPSLLSSVCVCPSVRICFVCRFSFQRLVFSCFPFVRLFSVREFAVSGVNSVPYRVILTGILKLALGSYPIAGSQVCPFLEGGPNGWGQT